MVMVGLQLKQYWTGSNIKKRKEKKRKEKKIN